MKYFLVILSLVIRFDFKSSPFLLVGFEPFNERDINISQLLISELTGAEYTKLILPVSFTDSWRVLKKESVGFSKILILGEYKQLYPRIELAANNEFRDKNTVAEINSSMPFSLHTRFSFKLSVEANDSGAGKFVCNYVYFQSLSHNMPVVFIHVPSYSREEFQKNKEALKTLVNEVIHVMKNTNYFQ